MKPLLLWAPWPTSVAVKAVVSTRCGGDQNSGGPYAGFNLGPTSGDDPSRVARHLAILQEVLTLRRPIRLLQQVHGTRIVPATSSEWDTEADGWLVEGPGTAVGIQTADCLPVALVRMDGSRAALLHVGWKGLAAGILQKGVGLLAEGYRGEIWAWVGPGIDAWAYQVQSDVRDAVLASVPSTETCFSPHTKKGYLFDIGGAAHSCLVFLGCRSSRTKQGTWSRPELWYSWRRAQPTGRQLGVLWMT